MHLVVLGSNGTYPTPGRPGSGYVVADGSTSIMLDIGSGTFAAGLEAGLIDDIDALVVSHRHPDHCADLPALLNYLRYGTPRPEPLPVFAPDQVAEHLAAFIGAGPDHAFFRIFDHRLVGAGAVASVGGIRLRFAEAEHSVPSVCVSVEGASRLVYTGDTGPGGDVVRLAERCDVLLCEATYQGERNGDGYPFHLHASEAGRIAADAGVGRLVVTHVTPTLDPDISVAEAAGSFDGPVVHASPGSRIDF